MRHVRGFRDGILAALVHAKGSFGVCVGVQGGHTGYVWWFRGVIWGVGGGSRGAHLVSEVVQGGHMGCMRGFRGGIWGV